MVVSPDVYYRCRFFKIEELVDPVTLGKYGPAKCWTLLDSRILYSIDCLREFFGPLVVNTWHKGGRFKHRGYRPAGVGSATSQHRAGRAIDFVPLTAPSSERTRFWNFHTAYSTTEVIKLLLGFFLTVRLLMRRRRRVSELPEEIDRIDDADDSHVNGR